MVISLSLYVSKSVWGTSLALNFKVALSESLGKDENIEQPGQKDKSKYVQMSIVQCEVCWVEVFCVDYSLIEWECAD